MGIGKTKKDVTTTVGVQLRPDGIALAVKSVNNRSGKPRIRCDFVSLSPGKDAGELLKTLVQKHGLQHKSTVALLDESRYSLLQTSSPAMPRTELRAAARWKIGELISFPVEQAVVDVFEYPEAGQRQQERLLYVVAAREEDVRNSVKQVRDAQLDLQAIDIGELAIRNIVSHLEENQDGVIVLNLSERNGVLVLVKQDEIYLSRRLDVGYADLETGDQYIFDNVVLELQRSLDYFERQFAQALPAKLLVYPPDRLSGEFILHVGSQINLTVEPLILEKMDGFTIDADEDSQSACLMAVGAALREPEGAPA